LFLKKHFNFIYYKKTINKIGVLNVKRCNINCLMFCDTFSKSVWRNLSQRLLV